MIDVKVLASSSKGNCYRIADGSTVILVECGLRYADIRRLLDFRVSEIAACLLSHEHADHSRAVRELVKVGVDCYMSAGTKKALGVDGHRVKTISPRKQFSIGTWTVLPVDTVHDAEEPLGFLMASKAGDKLLYATDTAYLRYRFRGLTHIMVECNFADDLLGNNVDSGAVPLEMKKRLLKSHFSLRNVKEFLRANDLSKVQEIWLLHLSDGNSDESRFKREIVELTGKPVFVAGDGGTTR